ncbi:MAG: DUF433 domain-containing protein [Candidatus Promineofilum sp.]|jgi:uncharacterized protein (DUF433 family)|nr:DUF433 domain-containing protein [Promineifilum sp.]
MELTPTLAIPLTENEDGLIRVGQTRVRLDTVVYAFNEGYTAEEIVSQYPALELSDVYAVIAYYLGHRVAVDQYVAERVQVAEAVRREIEAQPEYQSFRQQLLKRRQATESR